MDYTIHPIATIHTDFADKFGIPRQSGLVPELTLSLIHIWYDFSTANWVFHMVFALPSWKTRENC